MALFLASKTIKVTGCLLRNSAPALIFVSWFNDENSCVREKQYDADLNEASGGVFAQSYEHLKTLPEFAGAADV